MNIRAIKSMMFLSFVFLLFLSLSAQEAFAWLVERVSLTNEGGETSAPSGFYPNSQYPSMSTNGRFFLFSSDATNIVSGDTNGKLDLFLRDRKLRTTIRVNVSSDGAQVTDDNTYDGNVSPDGRYVIFSSKSLQLAPDANGKTQVYIRDIQEGKTTMISRDANGAAGDNYSSFNDNPVFSPDGRYVAYSSKSSNIVAGVTSAYYQIYLYDRQTGQTSLITKNAEGAPGNNGSTDPVISSDGRYIAFISYAKDLTTPNITATYNQILLHDRQTGQTKLVSKNVSGAPCDRGSSYPGISGDGKYVVFHSYSRNLDDRLASDNSMNHVYLYDNTQDAITLITHNAKGELGDAASSNAVISPDGQYMAFHSYAQNLLEDNTNISYSNIFLYNISEETFQVVNITSSGEKPSSGVYLYSAIADEANAIAFQSSATNLVADKTHSYDDIFVSIRTTDNWSIEPMGQIGGYRDDLAVSGSLGALIEGYSVCLYDLSGEKPEKTGIAPLEYEPARLTILGNYVYAVSGWDDPRFTVIDITDPSAPVVKGECEAKVSNNGSISANAGYVYITIQNEQYQPDIQVIDVSDKDNPSVAATLGIPGHGLTVSGSLMYVVGEDLNGKKFWIYDLTAPLSPQKTGEYSGNVFARAGASLYVDGNRLYSAVQGWGAQIFDITDPAVPGKYSDISGSPSDVYASENTMYITENGKVITYDVTNPQSPEKNGEIAIEGVQRIKGSGGSAYAMIAWKDMAILRIGISGGQPVIEASGGSPAMSSGLLADGERLYMGTGEFFWIMNTADPSDPQVLAKDDRWKNLYSFSISNNNLFGTVVDKLYILNVADPAALSQVSEFTLQGRSFQRTVSGNLAFITVDTNNDSKGDAVEIIDVSNTASPVKVGNLISFDGQIFSIAAANNLLCVAGTRTSGKNVVDIYDITSTSSPILASTIEIMGDSQNVSVTEDTLIVSSNLLVSNSYYVNYIEAFDLSTPSSPKKAGNITSQASAEDIKILEGGDDEAIILLAKPGGSVHTYGYQPSTGSFYPGPVCHSPSSYQVTVSPTPNSYGGYTVVTSDSSYGTYIQEITKKPTTCCLTTSVSPAEAAADGCTAAPVKVDPVECGTSVTVTATPAEPWVFKEWTGAASGTNPISEANVTGSCSQAVAVFWAPTLLLGTGTLNPSYETEFYGIEGEFDYTNGRKNVIANHITLTANEVDDWLVKGLTYHTSGAGNEKEDIAEARLYLNSVGGQLLGTGTFSADNSNITFGFNHTIPKSSSASFVLVYDYKPERAFPCNDYRTKIDMGDVNATPINFPPGRKLPVPPNGAVHGAIVVKRGDIAVIDGDRQYGEAEDPAENEPLEKSLKTRLKWQHPDTINFISYDIMSPVNGAFLGGVQGTTRVEKQPDAEGYVEETMTLGDKKGQKNPYYVQLGMSQKGATCYSSWAPPIFTEWGLGIDLGTESQYDNPQNGDSFGTFLSNIQANNKFTLTIDMAPPDYAQVEEVIFKLGDETKTGNVVTQNKVYDVQFDMSNFTSSGARILYVTIVMTKDGSQIEQKAEYSVKSIALPSWVNTVGSICHEESFTKEFSEDDGGTYTLTFNYPTNFAWSDYVPGDIGLLGGLNNDLDIEFSASAAYRVNETSTFGATVKGQPVILGQEFSLEGGLSGDFDPSFAFQRGNGNLSASFSFDLPEKGYSKTFLVYGVPVTAAVDLSGSVEIFIKGSAVLNRQLEFEEITVAPGTTVTGNITISLSAVFGLAKIAATGSPTATVEIEVKYTTGSGTTTTWRGNIVVPIKVVGSIFWGLGSAELCSTELGPWTFGSGGGASPQAYRPLGDIEGPVSPRLLSTSSMAVDANGNRMTLWIDDTAPNDAAPDPDVFYRYFNGSAWSNAAPLYSLSPNSEWETDPKTVFMAGGNALAAWTSNKGDKSLNDLDSILANQDIVFSVFNGNLWSDPVRLTNDNEADGTVSLAYDGSGNQAFAVWVHNEDQEKDAMNRTAWKLLYSVFDPAANAGAGGFAVPADVPLTSGSAADQMPVLASDGSGSVLLLWARDDDGEFYTQLAGVENGTNVDFENTDSHIYWTKWNGTGWSDPLPLATGGKSTRLSPSVAFSPYGSALAVWSEKEVIGGAAVYRIMYSIFNGTWLSPEQVTESSWFMEDPKAVVDSSGMATVIWRGHSENNDGGGALYSSTGEMPDPSWSEPKQITHDNTIQWQADVALDENDEVYTMWSAYDAFSGAASTGEGFGSGVNIAIENPESAALTGTYSDRGVDVNTDDIYESLEISVGVDILTAGDYRVQADLYKGVQLIASADKAISDLATGNYNILLNFPGGIISDRGFDGPYTLKNLLILDCNNSPVQTAFADVAYTTTGTYTASEFVCGSLSLDADSYMGTGAKAIITVNNPAANTDAESAQTVTVAVSSTRDSKGFSIALIETGPNTGIFQRDMGFSLLASSSELRQILISDHDMFRVVYHDLTHGYMFTQMATWTSAGAGDVNGDGQVDLADAILTLQSGARISTPDQGITRAADVNGDEKIGVEEAIYILRLMAE